MGRGVSGAVGTAVLVADEDDKLVAAVREGDDRAFETLYARYHSRVARYVRVMVKDHGRAEDVTQEVFVAALRRMRETERPIAFRPWIHEIAKNACIDHFRRSRRADEVSLGTSEDLMPGSAPAPDAAVLAREELHDLCGAFDELSDTHHEILVLRELEGLSYREIGERMGLTRPAVESTLFRARRRLTEEYGELATGARCRRIHGLIAPAAAHALGTRDMRRLARHLYQCKPCRREAVAAGVDSAILTYVPLRRRIAALLPLPGLARWSRMQGTRTDATSALVLSEQLHAGWLKGIGAIALLVAGLGASGVGPPVVPGRDGGAAGGGERPATAAQAQPATGAGAHRGQVGPDDRATDGGDRRRRGASSGGTGPAGLPGAEPRSSPGRDTPSDDAGGGTDPAGAPATAQDPARAAQPVVDEAKRAVERTTEGVNDTTEKLNESVRDTTGGVNETVRDTTGRVNETVRDTTRPAGEAVEDVGGAVQDVTQGAGETAQPIGEAVQRGGPAGQAVPGATEGAGQAVEGVSDTVQGATQGTGGLLRPPR